MYEGVKKEVMIERLFGCEVSDITKNVVISPIWPLQGFIEKSETVKKNFKGWYKGVTVTYKGEDITIINSGIGAPLTGDCVIALSYSQCENILFSGSAGAINDKYNFGDILICSSAVVGEGFSRFHSGDIRKDCFGETVNGCDRLAQILLDKSIKIANDLKVSVYQGRVFSTDSILGETKESFDFMIEKGCDAVEMEVSAVFTACKAIGRNSAALITISDLPLKYKSLFEGVAEEDTLFFKNSAKALPQALLDAALEI